MPDYFAAIQSIAEQRIREAQEAGEFDNLPGAGQPLVIEDLSHVPPELRMAWKVLKNAGCLPEEVANRKEIGNIMDLLDNCQDEKVKLAAMRKLRLLLERMQSGRVRHALLEASDEYYQKALARLQRGS